MKSAESLTEGSLDLNVNEEDHRRKGRATDNKALTCSITMCICFGLIDVKLRGHVNAFMENLFDLGAGS